MFSSHESSIWFEANPGIKTEFWYCQRKIRISTIKKSHLAQNQRRFLNQDLQREKLTEKRSPEGVHIDRKGSFDFNYWKKILCKGAKFVIFAKTSQLFSECEQQREFHQMDQELDPVLSSGMCPKIAENIKVLRLC